MKTLTLFVSSPGDVRTERQIVGKVIEKLQARYWNFIRLEPVLWEKEPLRATGTFQKEIVRPSSCELVVGILWNRLGTPLPEEFATIDGKRWDSGTEWELHDAVTGYEAQLESGIAEKDARPHVLAYKRTSRRLVEETEEKENEARAQSEKLRDFESAFFFHPDGSAKRARFTYETLEAFEQTFETHLNDLVRDELSAFARQDGEIPIVPVSGSPFKGLRAFDVADAPLFFGRFRAITEVLAQLQAQRAAGNAFVMIYGSSGFGKSSLMCAGVASRLIEPGFIPGTDAWRHACLYPARGDGSPCENLARAIFGCLSELAAVAFSNGRSDGNWDVARLSRTLETDARNCFDAIDSALAKAASSDAGLPAEMERPASGHLCLLLDQFEELFTREDLTHHGRDRFFHALGLLSTHPRVWILATMRSEYFPRLGDHEVLKSLTEKDGGYLLTRPELTELNQIIRYPALAAGLGFETDRETNESLSARLYQDMTSDPGALPLLQFCLEELYERREKEPETRLTWTGYREIGGLRGSIATVANSAWEALSESALDASDRVFSELVTISEEQRTLPVRKDADYDALAGASPGAKELLDQFVAAKLLIGSGESGPEGSRRTITLAHEALITHWSVLRDWIGEHRYLLRSRRRLSELAAQWVEQNHDRRHLLNEGQLRQALDVESCGFFALAKDERECISRSKRRARQRLVLPWIIAVVSFVAGVVLSVVTIREREKTRTAQTEARTAETEARTAKTRGAISALSEVADNAIFKNVDSGSGAIAALNRIANDAITENVDAGSGAIAALNRIANDALLQTVDAGPEEVERRSKFIEVLEKTIAEIPESERDRDYERVEAIALSLRSAQDLQEANPANNPELQLDPGVLAAMMPLIEEMQKGPDKSWDKLNELLRKAQAAHFAASDQLQAANEKNQRALDMFARLLPLFPEDADLRRRTGTAANLRVQFLASDEEEILAYHKRAVEAFTELGEIDADRKAESLGHLAETYDRVATFYQNLMEPQRAEPLLSKAAKLREQLLAEYADELKPTFLNALAGNYEGLAGGLMMDSPDRAEIQQQKAAELRRNAFAKARDESTQLALASALSTLSLIQGQLQKNDASLASGRDAVSHFEVLLQANPSNQSAIEGIALVLENIGRAYLRMGDSNRRQRANHLAARFRERLRNVRPPNLRDLDNEQSILFNSATKQLFSGMQTNDPAQVEAGIRGLWQQLGLLEHGLWLTRDSLLQQGMLAEPHLVPGYWNKKVELTAQFLRHAFPPNELADQWTAYEQASRAAPPNFLAQGVSPEQLAVARASHDLATGLLAGSPDSNRQTLARVLLTVGQRILTQADASGALDDAGRQRLEAISSAMEQLPKPRFERSVLDELDE